MLWPVFQLGKNHRNSVEHTYRHHSYLCIVSRMDCSPSLVFIYRFSHNQSQHLWFSVIRQCVAVFFLLIDCPWADGAVKLSVLDLPLLPVAYWDFLVTIQHRPTLHLVHMIHVRYKEPHQLQSITWHYLSSEYKSSNNMSWLTKTIP